MAAEMKISSLEVCGDSMLVINQLLIYYKVRKDDLIPYHQMATQLLENFDFVTLEHVPRKDNQMADALANLAATLELTKDKAVNFSVCHHWVVLLTLGASQEGVNVISVLSIIVDDWRQPLIDYLKHGKLPDDSRHRSEIGDLVLALCRPIITRHKIGSKFTSKWDGPYVVQEVYTSGAYKIVVEDGVKVGPINGKFLKRYYA
ncbi:hypothetical protein L3X38_001784 [Prunus dulcis]|uniref:RNase H type-1 domain-containing protein n=1 Tax=Prunus dulcis TaxID=3755 RepID=A0AAD4WUQ9_PRUDU|nr:hypothetical protein L3X38_001784 [Prunus dulcis]